MSVFLGSSAQTKELLELLDAGRKTGIPCILWGPPGVGKTAVVKALAKKHDLAIFILIASTMDPTDINGLPAIKEMKITHPDGREETVITTEPTLQYWSEALIRAGKGILFFDEASTATPAVQATLLSVLQGRLVGRHVLPDDVWMIAAANPADEAADGWELAAPMANRFLHIDYIPNIDDWCEGMACSWLEEGVSLREQEERFKIVTFIKTYPNLWNKMPTTSEEQGKAWPSPRTWDAAARILGHVKDPAVRSLAVRGLVGDAASIQFETFELSYSLPDYNLLMASPTSFEWSKMKPSEVLVTLNMVIGRLNAENITQSCKVFEAAFNDGQKDICVSLGITLGNKIGSVQNRGAYNAEYLKIISTFVPFLNEATIV